MLYKHDAYVPRAEAKLQLEILDFLRKQENVAYARIGQATTRGAPDIVCCVKGRFIAIELKSATKHAKQSVHQVEFARKTAKAGGKYFLIKSFGEFELIWEKLKQ